MSKINGAKEPVWEIDFNGIKRKEGDAFRSAFEEAGKAGNDDPVIPWMTKVIKRWPFTGDPSKVEDYGELGLEEYAEVSGRFLAAFQRIQSAKQGVGGSGASASEGTATGSIENPDSG